ncbi:hypothetical protein H9Q69_013674 [Fusarium xylarioides]|uniref:Uncharacterized protein n=1 Tax=Fusarium xylarioides TaxID=221167 RepID=A0A9P7IAB5_9HYPO|nr:hypothetical protein H9Q70_007361 [Fusarium xylarioides]KAG5764087.1 hypothetical protein H9Q72_007831 [Fusarium xylarioides]KAG5787258.1 hypothetical protein H9Q69_013674 [Fusarium xylarioides]KAG5803506.1 hypothetical protein H9Q71_011906 [Fusarium xylarioides]KAG5812469.1 hypothetical protein H9Q74_013108 [Fusarium xylarioides]
MVENVNDFESLCFFAADIISSSTPSTAISGCNDAERTTSSVTESITSQDLTTFAPQQPNTASPPERFKLQVLAYLVLKVAMCWPRTEERDSWPITRYCRHKYHSLSNYHDRYNRHGSTIEPTTDATTDAAATGTTTRLMTQTATGSATGRSDQSITEAMAEATSLMDYN